MNEDLKKAYEKIFVKYKHLIYDDLKEHYSKVFLPISLDDEVNPNEIMFIGRETRGWGNDSKWNNPTTVEALTAMYAQDYGEGIKSRSRGVSGFLKRIKRETGVKAFWSNFCCVDFKKGKVPNKSPYYEQIMSLSKELLSVQIKILNPRFIIVGYGKSLDRNRSEIRALLSEINITVEGEHYLENVIKDTLLWKMNLSNGVQLYDLAYHPAARALGSGIVRKKVLEDIKNSLQR